MKIMMGMVAVISLCFSINVFAENMDSCMSIKESWGKNYGSTSSFQVEFENQCSQDVYLKKCLERPDGRWDCGSTTLEAGGKNKGAWVCQGTGNYKYAACTGGFKECGFPTPKSK